MSDVNPLCTRFRRGERPIAGITGVVGGTAGVAKGVNPHSAVLTPFLALL